MIKQLLEDNYLSPQVEIGWGGGEPTIAPEFEALLEEFAKLDPKIYLYSNCVKRSEALIDAVRQGKIFKIICSVDAGTPETYKLIRQRDVYHQVWHNLEELQKNAGKGRLTETQIIVKYIFLENNISHKNIISFIQECVKRGIKAILFSIDYRKPDISADIHDAIGLMAYEASRAGIEYSFDMMRITARDLLIVATRVAEYWLKNENESSATHEILQAIKNNILHKIYENYPRNK